MELLKAIKKTIDYAKDFGCPINEEQIYQRLISKKVYKLEEIKKGLKSFKIDDNKNKWLEGKERKVENLSELMKRRFKDVLFLGISGSVATEYPRENDDIDIMLIIKKNKLWLTRFKLRWFIFVNKIPHRKYGKGENKDEFCFNLWLDEANLKLPKNKQNLKNAIDLILLKPIINRQKTYEKFISVNVWVKKYLATGYFEKTKDLRNKIYDLRIKERYFDYLINKLFFWPQYWYMRRRITNEKVNYYHAFFHK